MRNKKVIFIISFVALLGITACANVQENSVSPTLTQISNRMENLGLQASGVFTVAHPDNGTYTMQEQAELWQERYPNNPLVDSLINLYIEDQVLATNFSVFTAQDCTDTLIYGIGNWIRRPTHWQIHWGKPVVQVYKELFGWKLLSDWQPLDHEILHPGARLYVAVDDTDICNDPGLFYFYEYAMGSNYLMGLIVYAKETTDIGEIESKLKELGETIQDVYDQEWVGS